MDKKELQKAQNIIDVLFYDDKALTQWQHELLENVISIAQTKLHQPPVVGRSEQLVNFLLHLNDKMLINNQDFDYEKEAKKYLKKLTNCH
jgi:hypothetical protein